MCTEEAKRSFWNSQHWNDALNLSSVISVLKKSWTNIAQQQYNTRKAAKKMTAVRDIQEMDNPERLRYFRVIDQLRGFGINEDLPLPQVSFRHKSYSKALLTKTL
jgi:hypothetical protein